ncbi:MAG: hypothetical protein ABI811_19365 [Acidobacteriota bacterium]
MSDLHESPLAGLQTLAAHAAGQNLAADAVLVTGQGYVAINQLNFRPFRYLNSGP